jgi:hypothetical protein
MIVVWTGHRPDLFRDPAAARAAVDSTALELGMQADVRFLVGGQRGVDTWAAQAAISAGIAFDLVLPLAVDAFTRGWLEVDRRALQQVMTHAAEVQIAGGYTERNRLLASAADLLVAVWTRTPGGGTAETIALAERSGTPIREILLEASPLAQSASGRGI